MWPLTSKQDRRTSGPENVQPPTKKDFFNTIGAKRTLATLPLPDIFSYPKSWTNRYFDLDYQQLETVVP
jgi:hypothetical protein